MHRPTLYIRRITTSLDKYIDSANWGVTLNFYITIYQYSMCHLTDQRRSSM